MMIKNGQEGNEWKYVDTKIGRIGLIGYDAIFPDQLDA